MKSLTYFSILFQVFMIININAQDKTGILILAHGGGSNWNEAVQEATHPLQKDYEVEVAFGMAVPLAMQEGINNLEAKGVDKIVVTQLFISSYSPIIRQNEYLLGIRDELADEPMLMDHSSPGSHSNHGEHSTKTNHNGNNHNSHHSMDNKKVELKQLETNSKIYLTEPLNDHPLAVDILYERVMKLSKSPADETVILVAHGPDDEDDNRMWVKTLDSIADQIRIKNNKFKNIFCMTVRDDAPKEIYEMAKENLRNIVNQASKDGKAIVVPVLLSQGGIEKGIVKRLEGLDYVWSGKTLLPHSKITDFIKTSVEGALKEEAKL